MSRFYSSRLALFLALLFYTNVNSYAQENSKLWRNESKKFELQARSSIIDKYRSLYLDLPAMISSLSGATNEDLPNAFSTGPVISLPMPDGSFSKFRVALSAFMPQALQDQFPEIRTFTAKGIDDPHAVAKLDYTIFGFHAMIITPGGWVFIDPANLGNVNEYISYYKKDARHAETFQCETMNSLLDFSQKNNSSGQEIVLRSAGGTLKTYRLAIACTGEYAAFYGGTVVGAMSGIVTSANRVSGVYELELAIRLTLIANNSLIVYINSATDPYTNGSGTTMLGENQTTITNVIGTANYDVGHVFSTGGGGVASLNVPCVSGSKSRGVTGQNAPIGDAYDIDYVAHEMGHQFGGNHTFNSSLGNCTSNRSSGAAYEPGSGTTIMAYAGICGADNIMPHSDAIFHTKSFDEIQTFITTGSGNNCPVATATGNTPPVVTLGSNYTIPISTPFILTGSATDANSDPLTYLWEEYDLGPQGTANAPSGNAPIFRDWVPVTENYRVFPRMLDLVLNQQTLGEILPSYARTLNFRLTARDNRLGGGGVTHNDATVVLTVSNTVTPFKVTLPNTAVTWFSNTAHTVTWDVSSTNIAPISCANVNILLSVDSGFTYPYTLLTNTPNDGSQAVTMPNIVSSKARIKVESVGNIFFDISNVNFNIVTPSPVLSAIFTSALSSNSFCAGNTVNVDYTTNGPANSGNIFTAELSNSSGSFASPVSIGTLSSVNAGTIIATIPGGTSTGTGYRIRVVSSTPIVFGTDNGTNVTVLQTPGNPGSITGTSTVCQGQTLVGYSVPVIPNATGYSWVTPSGATITAGANTNSITVSFSAVAVSGNITVQGTNAGCSSGSVSTPFAVTVNQIPVNPGVITGTSVVCQSSSGIPFSVAAVANATSYLWTLPTGATVATGANTNSITVDFSGSANSGVITVKGVNACGNSLLASSFTVTVNSPPPSPVITAGGTVDFCNPGSVNLSFTPAVGVSYQWRKDGVNIAGQTGSSYLATTTGNYDVVASFTAIGPQSFSNNTRAFIPDNICPGGASLISVSGYNASVNTAGITLQLNITHTYVGDLVIMMEANDGNILGLSNRTGNPSNAGNNFVNTVFSDAATIQLSSGTVPYTSTYLPVSPTFAVCFASSITTFSGIGSGSINPNGDWTLGVFDLGGSDTGSIQNWTLNFPATIANNCTSTSNAIAVVGSNSVAAGVSISASPGNTICSGVNVTFTAVPVNGGSSPSYQWKNGTTNVGSNSPVYSSTSFGNGNVITCVMTSNASCVTGSPATSTGITMNVTPLAVVNSFSPLSGLIGTSVVIGGSGFTGTTAVRFNGVSAAFVVNNDGQITATVPASANTGLISVQTPCGISNSSSNFTVVVNFVTLNLKLFIEGYYQPGITPGFMNNKDSGGLLYVLGISPNANDVDTVYVSAMNATTFAEVDRKAGILHTDGTVSVTFGPSVLAGTTYFIKVNHRSALETWSSNAILLTSTYDFTNAQSKAFGNNMIMTKDNFGWAFYSGDISNSTTTGVQDGIIDVHDADVLEAATNNFVTGYFVEDITGDGFAESGDYSIIENNVKGNIVVIRP